MTTDRSGALLVWRVGHHTDPLGFTPHDLCAWNHRFDDAERRFRTLYVAEQAETAVREVVADFRPNAAAVAHFRAAMGDATADDIPSASITASWRRQHVLALARLGLDGPICDLTDVATRHAVETAHVALLREHAMRHLDLHEITSRRRVVTQTISGRLHDDGFAAIRFPSRLDGCPCLALFEGRTRLSLVAAPLPLTDPPPDALVKIAAEWELQLEPSAPVDDDAGRLLDEATRRMVAEEPW